MLSWSGSISIIKGETFTGFFLLPIKGETPGNKTPQAEKRDSYITSWLKTQGLPKALDSLWFVSFSSAFFHASFFWFYTAGWHKRRGHISEYNLCRAGVNKAYQCCRIKHNTNMHVSCSRRGSYRWTPSLKINQVNSSPVNPWWNRPQHLDPAGRRFSAWLFNWTVASGCIRAWLFDGPSAVLFKVMKEGKGPKC